MHAAIKQAEGTWTKKVGPYNVKLTVIPFSDGTLDPTAPTINFWPRSYHEDFDLYNWWVPLTEGSTFGHELGHDLLGYPENLPYWKADKSVMASRYDHTPLFTVGQWDIEELLKGKHVTILGSDCGCDP
jgi:hypothetical protein